MFFTRVLIDAIDVLLYHLATLQQFFKKRPNRRYYHFKKITSNAAIFCFTIDETFGSAEFQKRKCTSYSIYYLIMHYIY